MTRAKTLAPHELEQERDAFLAGVVVDHLDGVVGEAEVEKAELERQPIEPRWSVQ